MIRETNIITETVVSGITYRHVTTLAKDSTEPNQIGVFCSRFIGDRMIRIKETFDGGVSITTTETDLDAHQRRDFEEQWRLNWTHDHDKMTYSRVSKMEVNGTVLCEEKTVDFDENDDDKGVITCKRSIGDKSITVKKLEGAEGGEGEMETKSGTDLRARYLELRDFEKEWAQLWQPDESF